MHAVTTRSVTSITSRGHARFGLCGNAGHTSILCNHFHLVRSRHNSKRQMTRPFSPASSGIPTSCTGSCRLAAIALLIVKNLQTGDSSLQLSWPGPSVSARYYTPAFDT